MRSLIHNADLKSLFTGVGVAAGAGLLMGLALQPQLRAFGEIEGPQIMAGVSGVRSAQPYDPSAGFNAYQNQIPDYVLGTDWLKPPEYLSDELPEIPYEDETAAFDEPAYEAPPEPVAVARWEEPPREPVRFPSTDGGVPYGVDLPPPPAPPEAPEDADLAEMAAGTPG